MEYSPDNFDMAGDVVSAVVDAVHRNQPCYFWMGRFKVNSQGWPYTGLGDRKPWVPAIRGGRGISDQLLSFSD